MAAAMDQAAEQVDRSRSEPNVFARQLFSDLPARYDALAYVLSFGQDRRWGGAVGEAIAAGAPELLLVVPTGAVGVALQIARRTRARVVGVALTPAMLAR